jgi:hypothetical protein
VAENPVPIPLQEPIARARREDMFGELGGKAGQPDPLEGRPSENWELWFQSISDKLQKCSVLVNSVSATGKGATIGSTDFSGGGVSVGLYRIGYYARVTTAAGTSSSLQLTFTWSDHGASPSVSTTAYTGNSTVAPIVGSFLLYTDAGSPINFVATYASVGSPSMVYELYLTLHKEAA